MAITRPAKKRPLRTEVLSETAYNHLIQKLLSNQLVPGDLLNRRQIAEELGISVAPVLEAVVQLENDGFLESIPRKGTLVKSIKPEDLRGELILREAYECQAARLYCGEPVRKHYPELRELAERAENLRSDDDKAWPAEFNFHLALIRLTDCAVLVKAFEKVMQRKLFMSLNVYFKAHPDPEHSDHYDLLEKLQSDDPDIAERAIRSHIRSGKRHLLG